MNIFFNGESHEMPNGETVADALRRLRLDPKQVAVEINLELCPRAIHAERLLQDGDRVEVVKLVGGG